VLTLCFGLLGLGASATRLTLVPAAFVIAALVILIVAFRIVRQVVLDRRIPVRDAIVIRSPREEPVAIPSAEAQPVPQSSVDTFPLGEAPILGAPTTSSRPYPTLIVNHGSSTLARSATAPREPTRRQPEPAVGASADRTDIAREPQARNADSSGAAPAKGPHDNGAAPSPSIPVMTSPEMAGVGDDAVATKDEAAPVMDGRECEIAFWRGYRKATFYARAFDQEGLEVSIAESRPFRVSGNGIPDRTEEAIEAHRVLLERLRGEGWESDGGGPNWFGLTLRRSVVV
jgi:hypothetical protein